MSPAEQAFHELFYILATTKGLPDFTQYGFMAQRNDAECPLLKGLTKVLLANPEIRAKAENIRRVILAYHATGGLSDG